MSLNFFQKKYDELDFPLSTPKSALFPKITAKWIYFRPYCIKGSYMEYQQQHGEDSHTPVFFPSGQRLHKNWLKPDENHTVDHADEFST